MTKLDKAIYSLECCIESDETAECPPGCPFIDDPDCKCELEVKKLAREVLKEVRKNGRDV